MPLELQDSPLVLAAIAFGVLGVLLFLAGILAFFRLQFASSGYRLLIGLLFLSLGALAGTVVIGMQGYRALTHEEVAARISVKPGAPKRFVATFRFPDGREAKFDLAGDEIYVDARIIKWHPRANVIGLHTGYELDRVGGRYQAIKDEREAERTVHALGRERAIDLYALHRRFAFLGPVFDTEYGSATFVPVIKPAELELRVSTTGLLLREAKPRKP
jgi:hypothetical protein